MICMRNNKEQHRVYFDGNMAAKRRYKGKESVTRSYLSLILFRLVTLNNYLSTISLHLAQICFINFLYQMKKLDNHYHYFFDCTSFMDEIMIPGSKLCHTMQDYFYDVMDEQKLKCNAIGDFEGLNYHNLQIFRHFKASKDHIALCFIVFTRH